MKHILLLSLLLLCHSGFAQVLNSSFENWTYSPVTQNWTLDHWVHADKNGNRQQTLFGTYRDSTAQSGQFALTLSRWYAYTYDIAQFSNSFTLKPRLLSGYYKYPESMLWSGHPDTASVFLCLTKTVQNKRDTLGFVALDLPPVVNYTYFEKFISYTANMDLPDSIFITIRPSKFDIDNGCANGTWCSFLTVDNLQLAETSGLAPLFPSGSLSIYPNPTRGDIRISGNGMSTSQPIRIYDFTGNLILEKKASAESAYFSLRGLHPGLYVVCVGHESRILTIESL